MSKGHLGYEEYFEKIILMSLLRGDLGGLHINNREIKDLT